MRRRDSSYQKSDKQQDKWEHSTILVSGKNSFAHMVGSRCHGACKAQSEPNNELRNQRKQPSEFGVVMLLMSLSDSEAAVHGLDFIEFLSLRYRRAIKRTCALLEITASSRSMAKKAHLYGRCSPAFRISLLEVYCAIATRNAHNTSVGDAE